MFIAEACHLVLRAKPVVAGIDFRVVTADLEALIQPLSLPNEFREDIRRRVVEDEERSRADLLISGLKIDRGQLGDLYEVIEIIARRVGARMPQVFVSSHTQFSAYAITIDGRGVLVLSPELLEFSPDALIAIASHEIGHLYLDHTPATAAERKVFDILVQAGSISEEASQILLRVRRNAQLRELAADRIALFTVQDWESVARALLASALHSEALAAQVNIATYISEHVGGLQFNAQGPSVHAVQTHPAVAIRLDALRQFDPEFKRILTSNSIKFI